jgi:predicted dehydrogenase
MYKVRIIGAGSIGNHLAHAFNSNGFKVEITDKDDKALVRSKEVIYPSRYGTWDDRITIIDSTNHDNFDADVVVIGTPPDTHIEVALEQLQHCLPSILLIEKPLADPKMNNFEKLEKFCSDNKIRILVGYNHRLTKNTTLATKIISDGKLGKVFSITSQTRESWNGIMKAHPWLNGPQDSYLSRISRGGGALYEHSHALNLLQYFLKVTNSGEIESVLAAIEIVSENELSYDRCSYLSLFNNEGNIFQVIQDVVTTPPLKEVKIIGTYGQLTWRTSSVLDEVLLHDPDGHVREEYQLTKSRMDDFLPEILHIEEILSNHVVNSPLDYKYAIDTMNIISAAFKSAQIGTKVNLGYENE